MIIIPVEMNLRGRFNMVTKISADLYKYVAERTPHRTEKNISPSSSWFVIFFILYPQLYHQIDNAAKTIKTGQTEYPSCWVIFSPYKRLNVRKGSIIMTIKKVIRG